MTGDQGEGRVPPADRKIIAPASGLAGSSRILTVSPIETSTSSGRITRAPWRSAKWLPIQAPVMLATPITSAISDKTFPAAMNNTAATTLLVRLSALVWPVARDKPSPTSATRLAARKLPVPGPKNPSEKPMLLVIGA